MKQMTTWVLACVLATTTATMRLLYAETARDARQTIPEAQDDGSAEIQADKFEVDRKTGWVTATDNVRLHWKNNKMSADRVRMHRENGDIEARGNVVMQQSGLGTWSGEFIEFNYKTGVGLARAGVVKTGVFHISAEELTRGEDGTLDARDICITTCTNAPGHWHWHATGHGRFKDNDYVEVFGIVPHFLGVPFAYFPYWYRDLDTHYGLRFIPGYTSRWGAYLLSGYVFNLYNAPGGEGVKLDSYTHLDYRTRRGIAVGEDLKWDLKDGGRGKLETYHAWDRNPPDGLRHRNWVSDVRRERYILRLRHEMDVTPRDQFLLRGSYVSDSRVSQDFFDRFYRSEAVPMNFATLSHREHTWAAGAIASGPLNTFYGGVKRLPEGWLNVMPQPLLNSGVNYESQTRAGYLNRDAAKLKRVLDEEYMYYPGMWSEYDLMRVDTAHRATMPFKLQDSLSVVPRAGYRGTYYSESENKNNVLRHSADLGVQASMRATSAWQDGYRHILEPYFDYSYQPVYYRSRNGRVYGFDRYDRTGGWQDRFGFDGAWLPYEWHGFRPGVRNLLQTRDQTGQTRTILDSDLYVGVPTHTDGPIREEGIAITGAKVIYSPSSDLDIKAHAEWDGEEDTFAYADINVFYNLSEQLRVGGGYLGRDHALYDYDLSPVRQWNSVKADLFYAGFTHEINDTWSWSLYSRYDGHQNELDEVGGYLQYQLDCLVFQLRSAYVNRFKRIDGSGRDDSDFRVAFMVWLRAENRSHVDRWMTW